MRQLAHTNSGACLGQSQGSLQSRTRPGDALRSHLLGQKSGGNLLNYDCESTHVEESSACVFLHARRRCVCQRKLLLLFSIYEKECSNSHQVGKI